MAEGTATCSYVRRALSDGGQLALRTCAVRTHLHGCGSCQVFRAGIEDRSLTLRSLLPNLDPVAASTVFNTIVASAGGVRFGEDGSRVKLEP